MMRRATRAWILGFLLLYPAALHAEPSSATVSGYLEYLSGVSEYPSVPGKLYDQIVHARINSRWYPSSSLTGALEVRGRAFYGDSVDKTPDFLDTIKTPHDVFNADDVIWQGKETVGYAELDRLWMDYTAGGIEATAGRQRIAWGTALVWNVIDVFNPKSVLDFDYEEKPGADALRVQYYTGPLSHVELADKPGRTTKESVIAGLYSINVSAYDLYAVGGIRKDRWMAGGAWAGDVKGAGFRGEALLSRAPVRTGSGPSPDLSAYGSSFFDKDEPVVSAVLSGDYTFRNSFYVHAETLYNSNGKTENAGVFRHEAADAGMLSPARWSLYQEFAYDLTPLTRTSIFGIFNPDDHSSIIVPMLTTSLKTDLDLLLIGLFASGGPDAEYGAYGSSVFARLRYSFK
jgi:hypothetical protein